MQNPIERWLSRVCVHLRTNRRGAAVRRELNAHLEDRMRLLRTQGMTEDEAAEQAVLSMGDPDELGRALSEADRPLRRLVWGMLTAAVWLAIAALVLYLLWCVLHNA